MIGDPYEAVTDILANAKTRSKHLDSMTKIKEI